MNNARKPCTATVFGHFLFRSVPHSYHYSLSPRYHITYSVRISAISLCLLGYKCEYVLSVVFISSCPNRSLIESGETPFVVEFKGHRGENMQIASIEDAWEELDYYITDAMWNKFIKLLYEVLIVSEPIFDHPFEKHFEVSIRVQKPDWSQALKRGMLRTLVMRAFYRKHDEKQYEVDNIIKEILETINTTKRWGYISQYMPELCEASPKAVIERLEKELESPSGLKELFEANDGDFMTSRHYYTNVLFAVEQLLQQMTNIVSGKCWLSFIAKRYLMREYIKNY